jgi:hypothetical protein
VEDRGWGVTILAAVTVFPATAPVTRIVAPTGNCCAVAGFAAVPNLVPLVIKTVTCLPSFVVISHDEPFSAEIWPATPSCALRGVDALDVGAVVLVVAGLAAPAVPPQPATPSATAAPARTTPLIRNHVAMSVALSSLSC